MLHCLFFVTVGWFLRTLFFLFTDKLRLDFWKDENLETIFLAVAFGFLHDGFFVGLTDLERAGTFVDLKL